VQAFQLFTALLHGQFAAPGQLAQIATGAEMTALAREHDRAHTGVGRSIRQRGRDGRVERGRQRIARSRVVVAQHQHGTFAADQQRHSLILHVWRNRSA
jgi:hypothetical protein